MLPSEAINNFLFSFFPSEANFNYQLDRTGYGGRNFIQNCGSVFWFIVLYLFGFFFFELGVRVFNLREEEKKWVKNASSFFKYNFLLSLFVEGFLELVISALVQI